MPRGRRLAQTLLLALWGLLVAHGLALGAAPREPALQGPPVPTIAPTASLSSQGAILTPALGGEEAPDTERYVPEGWGGVSKVWWRGEGSHGLTFGPP